MADLQATQTENTLVLTKIFDAPRELVFEMFKNPDHLAKWWGPTSWPATIKSFDFTPGGKWHYYMTGPDGTQAWGMATFQEIDEPNQLTYIDAFCDENGVIDESLPQGQVTFTFGETDGKTTLTMTGTYKSAEDAKKLVEMGMVDGMTDTWNQLERLLAEQS
jgi:uncharacterized protein YndB with AHSA1/START domain